MGYSDKKALQVVWTNPFGDIFLDPDIKLFEFEDVQKYSGYNDPPKSREFCRFYTSSSSKVKVQRLTTKERRTYPGARWV